MINCAGIVRALRRSTRGASARLTALWIVAILLLVSGRRSGAQDSSGTTTGWSIRAIHVEPHLIVLDPEHRSATLTFRNTGNAAADADVLLQLGYTYFPVTDTALFPRNWTPTADNQSPRDTVIVTPKAADHYAGAWLSGVPTHVHLAANETRTVTMQIKPPAGLPNGEYYARIITLVGAHLSQKSQDTRQRYTVPSKGHTMPPLRDSVRIFYRQGPQTMGLAIRQAEATEDTSQVALGNFPGMKVLRFLVRYHLSGTTHFEGRMRVSIGKQFVIDGRTGSQYAFALHRDGVMRWLIGGPFSPGQRDTLVVAFFPLQDEFPAAQRVPMDSVVTKIPFSIKAP